MKLLHEEFLTDEDNKIIKLINSFNDNNASCTKEYANKNILCDIIYANIEYYSIYFNDDDFNKLKNYLYKNNIVKYKNLDNYKNIEDIDNDKIIRLKKIIEQKNDEIIQKESEIFILKLMLQLQNK